MTISIGILGTGFIPPKAMIEPSRLRSDTTVYAVGSRSIDKARSFATDHDIPVAYGSYEDVISDPEVDLVYIALPPSEHARWASAALTAGKHVLCEKPVTMNSQEARQLADLATVQGLQMIEASHDRYHPLFRHAMVVARSKQMGAITGLRAAVSLQFPFDPDSFRHNPRLGGGALMEFGCYGVRWVRAIAGAEPTVTSAVADLNPLGGDSRLRAQLAFPNGITAEVLADGHRQDPGLHSFLEVTGEDGRVLIEDPIAPHTGHSVHAWVKGGYEVYTVAGTSSFDYQLDAVVQSIDSGLPTLTSGQDFTANMLVIDQIFSAAGMTRDFS